MTAIIYDILHDGVVKRGIDIVNICARHGIEEDHEITGHCGLPLDICGRDSIDSLPVHFFRGVRQEITINFGKPAKLWIARSKQTGDTKVELHTETL